VLGVANAAWLAAHSTSEKQLIAGLGVAFYIFLVAVPMPIEAFIALSTLGFVVSLALNMLMFVSNQGCFFCFLNLVIVTALMLIGFMKVGTSRLLKTILCIAILVLLYELCVLANAPDTKIAFSAYQGVQGDCPCGKGLPNAKK
jgi:hypothetical protein